MRTTSATLAALNAAHAKRMRAIHHAIANATGAAIGILAFAALMLALISDYSGDPLLGLLSLLGN